MMKNEQLLDVVELATFLNCSVALVQKKKRKGEIPYIKIGSLVRFQKDEVLNALKDCVEDYY